MPAFDLRFITAPEDLPRCLISIDASQRNAGDVVVAGGFVSEILNRAPRSLRNYRVGDQALAKWWNAVSETSSTLPTVNLSAFGGAGGIDLPSGADFLMTSLLPFDPIVAGEFTAFFAVDYTHPVGAPLSYFTDDVALEIALDSGFGSLAWLDGGAGGTGSAGISGPQYHAIRFGKATPISSSTTNWRRNGSFLSSGTYTPANFGGGVTKIFGGPSTAGRMLFFDRRLTDTETEFLECTVSRLFGISPGARVYAAPVASPWLDPAGAEPTRLNSVSGVSERYYKVRRAPSQPVSVLVEALIDGELDTSPDFVPWFVEWPYQGGASPEPTIYQEPDFPGICRLDLTDDGHYLFELWRPGGGAVLVHFDVVPF